MLPKGRKARPTPEGAHEASRIRDRFEQLVAAGIAIFSEHALEKVLQRVADSAREVIGARYSALGVLGDDGVSLGQFVTSGISDVQRAHIGDPPRGQGVLGIVIHDAKPLRVAEISRHPQSYGFPPHHPTMHSFLGVPIRNRGRVYGNLYLAEKIGAKEFSAEDEAIAVFLATKAAVAIENTQLYEQSSRLLGELQQMQRQREHFFAMVNHELRNALTGVYGWAERLVRGKSTDGPMGAAAREVYEAAERTIVLLNNLLDLSRLDAGKTQAAWREVAVPLAVRRACSVVRPSADAKGLTIREDYPDPPPSVRTDAVRLVQILVNLLSNAVRHSPDKGEIVVRVEPVTGELLFHVIDHGGGIPIEAQGRIFELFERGDSESGLGSGLGLPVSRRLAEVLGGRLTVQSAPGEGATFSLALPVRPADAT